MKDKQRLLEVTVAEVRRGEAPPPRRRKWRVLQERIARLREEYNNGDRTLRRYWNAVVYLIKSKNETLYQLKDALERLLSH